MTLRVRTISRYDPKRIGALIRYMRKKSGLTREELGAELDLHGASITRIERGTHRISLEHLMKAAQKCGFELCVSVQPTVE